MTNLSHWDLTLMGMGGILPLRLLMSRALGLCMGTLGWAELKAGWLDNGCSRPWCMTWVSLRQICLLI